MNNAFKEATLSLEMILNLFTISSKFDISTLLSAYTTHIISRISKKNVIFILQYLLLSQDTPSTRSNDLIILSHCLDVLISSLKIIMTNSRQDIRQLLILQEIFVKLFEIPLNSSSEDESTPLL